MSTISHEHRAHISTLHAQLQEEWAIFERKVKTELNNAQLPRDASEEAKERIRPLQELYDACLKDPTTDKEDWERLERGIEKTIEIRKSLSAIKDKEKQRHTNLLSNTYKIFLEGIEKYLEVIEKAHRTENIINKPLEDARALSYRGFKCKKVGSYPDAYSDWEKASEIFKGILDRSANLADQEEVTKHALSGLLGTANGFWEIRNLFPYDPQYKNMCCTSAYKIRKWRVDHFKKTASPEYIQEIENLLNRYVEMYSSDLASSTRHISTLLGEAKNNIPDEKLIKLYAIALRPFKSHPSKSNDFNCLFDAFYWLLHKDLHEFDVCALLDPIALPDDWLLKLDPPVLHLLEAAHYYSFCQALFWKKSTTGQLDFQYAELAFKKVCNDSSRDDEHGVYKALKEIKIKVYLENPNKEIDPRTYKDPRTKEDYGQSCFWKDEHHKKDKSLDISSSYQEKAKAIHNYLEIKLGKPLFNYLRASTSIKIKNLDIWK